jgi:hypothetical protein
MRNCIARIACICLFAGLSVIAADCGRASGAGGGMQGTYTDATGSFLLELKSGGNANFTYMGDDETCKYTTSGTTLTVNCNGPAGTTVFNIHDDGSLTGPPGSFFTTLSKKKT